MVVDGTQVKVIAWYDNEWGYSSRLVELAQRVLVPSRSRSEAQAKPCRGPTRVLRSLHRGVDGMVPMAPGDRDAMLDV